MYHLTVSIPKKSKKVYYVAIVAILGLDRVFLGWKLPYLLLHSPANMFLKLYDDRLSMTVVKGSRQI